MAKDWIEATHMKKGALHSELGVPQGQKIPAAKLAHAADAGGKLGERARMAETLKGLPHRAMGGPVPQHIPTVVGERGPELVTSPMPGAKVTPIDGSPDVQTPILPPAHRLKMAILHHLTGPRARV